jgi:hypothetical protein
MVAFVEISPSRLPRSVAVAAFLDHQSQSMADGKAAQVGSRAPAEI